VQTKTDLVLLRRPGEMPFDWLTDSTRWQRKRRTFRSIEHSLLETAHIIAKRCGPNAEAYVEIWLEKKCLRRDGQGASVKLISPRSTRQSQPSRPMPPCLPAWRKAYGN